MKQSDGSQHQQTSCDELVDSIKAGAVGLVEAVLSSAVDYLAGHSSPPSSEEPKNYLQQAYEGLCDFLEGRNDFDD